MSGLVSYVWGLVFLRLELVSYVWGSGILTFGG